ncbi:MAG TPA: TIGR02391 family protein, partial [Gemmatimonadaceae bacterium]
EKGVLKVTACKSDTDANVQDGVKFLSAGLMSAIRNPTSHEPALDWPITREDCLDILSFISFLFRKLDIAVYHVT